MNPNITERLFVLDTETTGVRVDQDRILTCYAMILNRSGEVEKDWSWTIDPGVEVPEGASAVHGMTTEWIREHGRKDWMRAISEIVWEVDQARILGIPIVAYNLRFDFSILWHEYRRAGRATGGILRTALKEATFYDPMIHDQGRDKFRKGKRRLVDLCGVYGIEFNEDDAHAAQYDVEKTGELAFKLLAREKSFGPTELMPLLVEWKAERDASLEEYFAKVGKRTESGEPIRIDRGWPLITKLGN